MGGRFLVTTWDGGGNVTPAAHLAIRLIRRGHDVLLMGWPSMTRRAAREAIPFTTYARLAAWPDGIRLEDDNFALMEQMTNGADAEADIIDTARGFRPDVVVIDCMMAAGFRAAAKLALPCSVLCHVLYGPYVDEWGQHQLKADVTAMFGAASQVLITVPPGLEPARSLPPATTIVGPICHPDPADASILDHWSLAELAQPGDPWVLLSLSSTLMGQREALPPILAAVEGVPARVLLTLADVVAPHAITAPRNVWVRGFVPHDFVLPHVDLVISHGGLSTLSSALVAGKPVVCIPQGRDQTLNARTVEACGAGQTVSKDAGPDQIRHVVEMVLRDPSYRAAALQIADLSLPLQSGGTATDLVEGLASRRTPA